MIEAILQLKATLFTHGFNIFVVSQGFGNFDPKKDPSRFNLVDPIDRNLVCEPSGGWVAIQFLGHNLVEYIILLTNA